MYLVRAPIEVKRVLGKKSVPELRSQVFGEAADLEQLPHGLGELGELIFGIVVMDDAAGKIDLDLIALRGRGI